MDSISVAGLFFIELLGVTFVPNRFGILGTDEV